MPNINIFRLSVEDLSRISKIHCSAFPGRALSQLGEETVRRYYKWLLTGPHEAENIGAKINDQLVGFCFGGIFHGSLSGFLRANRFYLICRIITRPKLLANELVRERISIARQVLRRRYTPQKAQTPISLITKSFGILAIAVDPEYQGCSVGRHLMEAEEKTARQHGFHKMHLSVDADNHQAIYFYERLGWYKVKTNQDNWQGRMEKRLE